MKYDTTIRGNSYVPGEVVGCRCEGCQALGPGRGHLSDCRVHDEPAYPKGPCSCGATIHSACRRRGHCNYVPACDVSLGWFATLKELGEPRRVKT
jgi:hypothetical protein